MQDSRMNGLKKETASITPRSLLLAGTIVRWTLDSTTADTMAGLLGITTLKEGC
ncbi:hypothetical protein LEMLEM_LOCUS5120 [Lemmus lemmus]